MRWTERQHLPDLDAAGVQKFDKAVGLMPDITTGEWPRQGGGMQ